MRSKVLSSAIERAGGVNALARLLGISSGAVAQWRDIPPRRLGEVARVTGLSLAELSPGLVAAAVPGLAEAQAPYVAEAHALGIDPGAVAGTALREAVGAEKARRWAEENRAAIEAWTRHFEENDTPLAEHRAF